VRCNTFIIITGGTKTPTAVKVRGKVLGSAEGSVLEVECYLL
jgi:hypothetical protein